MVFFPTISNFSVPSLGQAVFQSTTLCAKRSNPGNGLNVLGTVNTATDLSLINRVKSSRKCSNDQ